MQSGNFAITNGGIIIKRQEMLQGFKDRFPEIVDQDPGILETFFYALTPVEKQAVLNHKSLRSSFFLLSGKS